ncbi:head decoration protein [Hoeflea olei]|uniref:Head decoration protein n=1 Tax=Hoeflea olei TaxID=1480615 RepID=A0A1C1YRX6_9HYPH|nr:head decoration protein [Hoeflea olei]OCW56285.1 hypothetical protein AWJ14_19515 [Hoeflea olei]
MATVLTQGKVDEGFLIGELNTRMSRETVTLAAGTYASGSVVISDEGGNYALATQALVDADVDGDATYAIVARNCSGTEAFPAAVIADTAAVKDSELVLGSGLTVAEVKPLLAKSKIKVRNAV